MDDHRAKKAVGATLSSRLIDHRRLFTGPGLLEGPPVLPALAVKLVAVKLIRTPTAYANRRILRIPLGEFPDHQCQLRIRFRTDDYRLSQTIDKRI